MKLISKEGLKYLKFSEFDESELFEHCITTRVGGVSQGPYAELNMGMHIPEEVESTVENFDKVANTVFYGSKDDVVRTDQVHGIKIKKVSEEDRGKGLVRERDFEDVDGLMTDIPGIILSTAYADCTPLMFIDEKKKVIASVHSGWKGTVGGIGEEAVKMMIKEYGSDIKDIKAGIGPTIGPESFEVGEEVYIEFKKVFKDMEKIVSKRKGEKYYLNLWEANKQVLLRAGLREENIFIDDHCTFINEDLFYSYRRDKGITGRMAAMIMIKK